MDSRKVAKNSLLYLIGAMAPSLLSLVTLPLYSRYLSPDDYGVLALIQTFSVFLPVLLSLQLHTSLDRFFFEYREGPLREFITTLLVTVLIFSSCSLALLLAFADPLVAFLFPSLAGTERSLFVYTLFTGYFNLLASFPITLMKVREKAAQFVGISMAHLAIATAITVVEVIVLDRGCKGFVESMLIASVLAFVVFMIPNLGFLKPKLDFSLLVEPIRFSLPIIPHSLSAYVFMFSDRYILEKFIPIAAIGLYAFADKLAFVVRLMVTKINESVMPHFMSIAMKEPQKAAVSVARLGEKTHFLLCLLVIITGTFSWEAFRLFFDERYQSAWYMFPLLSSAFIFRNLYQLASCGLFLKKKTGIVALATAAAAATNIGVNLLLIPSLGVVAAIYSTIAAHAITYLLATRLSKQVFPIPLAHARCLALTAGIYLQLGIVYLLHVSHLPYIPILAAKIALLTAYVWAGWKLDYFTIAQVSSVLRTFRLKVRLGATA